MKFNTNKILAEWAYRVDDGQPDVTNVNHVNHLREVLYNFGLPHKFIVEYVHGLTEIDFPDQSAFQKYDAKHKMRSTTKVTIGGKTTTAGQASGKKKETDTEDEPAKAVPTKKEKSKELKTQIDNNSKSFTKSLEPADEKFNSSEYREKNKLFSHQFKSTSITTKTGKSYDLPLTTETLQSFFPSDQTKFPKRYIDTMQRILNTQHVNRDEPTITKFINGVGAGAINAQSAELLTLMATSMDDDNFNNMIEVLNLAADQTTKPGIIDKVWLQSVQGSRDTTLSQIKRKFGENATVEFSGWDTQDDAENVIGLSDSKSNKGHSTDVYFRVKTDDGPKIHEVSLKKDLEAPWASPSTSQYQDVARANGITIDKRDDAETFKSTQDTNASSKLSTTNNDTIVNISTMIQDEQGIVDKLSKLPQPISNNLLKGGKGGKVLSPELKRVVNYTKKLKEAGIEYPLDNETYNSSEHTAILKELKLTGGKGEKKLATFMAYAQMANESKDGQFDKNGEGYKFLQKHIGIDKDPETGRYPEGSSRDFSRRSVELLAKPEMINQTMDMIQEKFPLKPLMSGEESMAASGFGMDSDTCEKIFGTSNYDEVKEKIKVEYDEEDDSYFLSYSVDVGGTSKSVKIAEVESRQRGLGYQGAPTYGLKPADEFKHRTICAQGEKEYNTNDAKTVSKYTRKFGSCENPSYGA